MFKHRGLRRYFKNLELRKLYIPEQWLIDGYFSFDKIRVDSFGFNSIHDRIKHFESLIRNFDAIVGQANAIRKPFQIWIQLYEFNCNNDCIMLHSQNPLSKFPYEDQFLTVDCSFKNVHFVNYLNQKTEFTKRYGTSFTENAKGQSIKRNFVILFKDDIGEKIFSS